MSEFDTGREARQQLAKLGVGVGVSGAGVGLIVDTLLADAGPNIMELYEIPTQTALLAGAVLAVVGVLIPTLHRSPKR